MGFRAGRTQIEFIALLAAGAGGIVVIGLILVLVRPSPVNRQPQRPSRRCPPPSDCDTGHRPARGCRGTRPWPSGQRHRGQHGLRVPSTHGATAGGAGPSSGRLRSASTTATWSRRRAVAVAASGAFSGWRTAPGTRPSPHRGTTPWSSSTSQPGALGTTTGCLIRKGRRQPDVGDGRRSEQRTGDRR